MLRRINKIKLYVNDKKNSSDIVVSLKEKLIENSFVIDDEDPDLVIAVGGDGTFLRMIKESGFDSNIIYVGINAGTLGFLQEIKIDDLDVFIECLNKNAYKMEEIGIQETEIITDENILRKYSLNEIVIREKDLNTSMLTINVNNAHLENFVGDGLLIATSVGSTAYNMSFGGSIVFNTLHTLQITPIAPLNSKVYRNLLNSVVVPENTIIEIIPHVNKTDLLVSIDGDNQIFNNVKIIKTIVKTKRIKCLRLESYNFFDKINDKFLSN